MTITVITPLWKTQPWFPVIMDMVIDHPILLPESPDIVIPSPNCGCPVQDHIPQLVAWKVSGDTSETGQFLKVLESSSLPLGGQRQMLTTTRPGGTWRKWEEWCTSHCVPTFSAFSDILGFLAHHFEQGKQYRSLNCYRSALSSCHLPIKGFSVGQHPLVSRLLKGAFNLRPPQPKYSSTWDVSTMLRYLLSLGPNDNLCLEKLTRKLAVLLALVLAHRASDLVRISLVGSTYTTEGVVLTCKGLAKTSKPGKITSSVIIAPFEESHGLCPVKCLQEYEAVTKQFRVSSSHTQLFLSTIQPHGPISSSTVARWLKKTLQEAGLDSHFSGHSTRGAAATTAALAGISTQEIMNRAGWSQENTFCRYYYHPPESSKLAKRFTGAVLSDSTNKHRTC